MLIYVLLIATCEFAYGATINEARIVGGEKVSIESFPYQVSLFYYDEHRCGGSILNNYFVITAGHCIPRFRYYLDVHYGINNTRKEDIHQYIKIDKIFFHPNYTLTNVGTVRNDIAILLLKSPIVFSQSAFPIPLATHEPNPGQMLVISGYGDIQEYKHSNGDLSATSVPTVDRNSCKEIYKRFNINHINEEFICGGYDEGKTNSCQGDSGGPVVLNGHLVGLVSFAKGCARSGIPGVYTNVANYHSWIMDIMKNHTFVNEENVYNII